MALPGREAERGGLARARARAQQYAVLVTGDPLAEVMESHGNFAECFERLLSDRDGGDDERWDAYRVFEGERCPRNLGEYDGVVVTGSKFDAHGEDAWIIELMRELRECHERRQRVLGICFGHQVLARSLGRTVERSGSWCLGANEISLDASAAAESCTRLAPALALVASEAIKIHQVHQDHVTALPPGARRIATSPECENEAFLVGDHILCVQGHPEFSNAMVRQMLELKRAAKTMEEGVVDKGLRDLETHGVDAATYAKWSDICKTFLKGP